MPDSDLVRETIHFVSVRICFVKLKFLLLQCVVWMFLALDAIAAPRVTITIPKTALTAPTSGRIYLFTSTSANRPPFTGPNWFSPEPFFAEDVVVKGGESIVLSGETKGFPGTLADLPTGQYFVQALFDFDIYHSDHAKGAGNLYSEVQKIEWDGRNRL